MARKVPEWIGEPDQTIPEAVQLRVVKKAGRKCEACKRAFDEKLKAEMHHNPPLWSEYGENRERNLVALCTTCHKVYTKLDAKIRAKANKRLAGKVLKRKPKRGGFNGWRKFDGTIVWKKR